ncbi:hypothetical protein BD413DRAFT_491652 [Trametes elegans]|nr:hypothetical protein BD413DRAFT_491652 [Trametes elegans]
MPSPYLSSAPAPQRRARAHSSADLSSGYPDEGSTPSLTSQSSSDDQVPESLRSNEIFVYYDSAWATDELRMPPVRMRRVASHHFQPVTEGATTGMSLHSSLPSSKRRPLVKAVAGKAKGLVKIVAKRSIRRTRKKHDTDRKGITQSRSAPTLTGGDWCEPSASGISIVIECESDAVPRGVAGAVVRARAHSESKFSLKSGDGPPVFVSPNGPQNSEVSILQPYTSPYLDEETAFELINLLYYGHMIEPVEEPAPAVPGAIPTLKQEEWTGTGAALLAPLSPALRTVLFVPWCMLVGGAIVLWPTAVDWTAFHTGFVRDAPRPGLRRFAYWAENAYEHVFLFFAGSFMLLHYAAGPNYALLVLAALLGRVAFMWGTFCPREDLHLRVGEDDMESIWLVTQGTEVVDTILGNRCACAEHCQCHGGCPLRCPTQA